MKIRKITAPQIINISFLSTILVGTLLLMLPFANKNGSSTSLIDALFTATSATCVTGLVVKDTATFWSSFGHVVIILLIQIGGMGTATIMILVGLLSGRHINLKQRSVMQEAISAPKLGGIVRYTKFIFMLTVLIEGVGALLLWIVFGHDFGGMKGLFYAIFHSISAFCNAGFDLMGNYSSLTSYVQNPLVNIVICSLIFMGGIGFLTWDDFKTHRFHIHKYRLQSKIVLKISVFLIVVPMMYFFFNEFSSYPLEKRILASLFQSVTPRTAGFNTIDYSTVSQTGLVITIFLMLVGGSPGSTAGGIKTTTLATLFFTMVSVLKNEESTQIYKRRISDALIRQALTVTMMYGILFVAGAIIMSEVEGYSLLTCLFECASAIGTVGLTLGITPSLSVISKIILIILMYVGRIGGMTLFFSFVNTTKKTSARLPQEKIFIG